MLQFLCKNVPTGDLTIVFWSYWRHTQAAKTTHFRRCTLKLATNNSKHWKINTYLSPLLVECNQPSLFISKTFLFYYFPGNRRVFPNNSRVTHHIRLFGGRQCARSVQLTYLRQTVRYVRIVQEKQKIRRPFELVRCYDVSFQHFNIVATVHAQHIVAVQKFCAALPLFDDLAVLEGNFYQRLGDVFGVENERLGAHFKSSILFLVVVGFRSCVWRNQDRTEVFEVDFAGVQKK